MPFMAGKFARFRGGSQNLVGPYRWAPGFRRERLDTTNFESASDGTNVASEGLTGVLDTTFTVEGYVLDTAANLFFPSTSLTCDLLYRKQIALGYQGIVADVLEFSPSVAVREQIRFTAQLQANGWLAGAT